MDDKDTSIKEFITQALNPNDIQKYLYKNTNNGLLNSEGIKVWDMLWDIRKKIGNNAKNDKRFWENLKKS